MSILQTALFACRLLTSQDSVQDDFPISTVCIPISTTSPSNTGYLKSISEINFKFPVIQGDVVEIGMQTLEIGKTSCTIACDVRSLQADRVVCSIDKMVYVRVNKYGLPKAHGGMNE